MDVKESGEHVIRRYEEYTLGTERNDDLTLVTLMLSERLPEFESNLKAAKDAYQNGNLDEACEILKKAADIFPRHADTLYLMGKFLTRNKKYKEALGYLQKYIELKPYDANAYTILAHCFFKLGNFQKAQDESKRSLSLKSNNPSALYSLIQVYIALGKIDDARNVYSALEFLKPADKRVSKLRLKLKLEEND